jgi:hypothetical protein
MRRALFLVVTVALAFATSAGAVETQTPISQMFFNPCTGETFVAQGTLKMSSDFTIGADGRVHERWHVTLHAMTAKGVITGAKYVVQEAINQGVNTDADGVPSTQRLSFKQHYVRSGESGALVDDDDFYLWFHIHLTINANGVPTATKIESAEDTCR